MEQQVVEVHRVRLLQGGPERLKNVGGKWQVVDLVSTPAGKQMMSTMLPAFTSVISETADDIMNLIIELNRTQQQTFVIVTHDARIGEMTNRIIRMKDGRVISDGR